jgi:hypothetical protein
MKLRWWAPLIVMIALVLGGFVQPLLDRAHAATAADTKPAMGPGSEAGPTHNGDRNGDPGYPADKYPGYGPVDQSAPLDFSTQPSSVPHTYVAGRLYNVQVLKQRSYGDVLTQMTAYTEALGVSCTYCHNAQNFAYDTPTKKIARTMAGMVAKIDTNWVGTVHRDYPNFAVSGAVGCVTCHRGQPRHNVEWNIVPVQYLDWPAKTTKQAGYVVNSMYSVSRSLGVNCLFCHNSADFVTLQYYPTNRIAHRMWQMVDAINHQYLPPNIKAVTCYTCHQGAKWPSKLVTSGTDQTPVTVAPMHPEVHDNPGAHLASGAR